MTSENDDAASTPNKFLRAWAWKREHRVRFHRPYAYPLEPDTAAGAGIIVQQAPFDAEGFASTVWDSSIVVGKYFERRGRSWAVGLRCLDLSAGCGLVGLVLARLGAHVTATDLPRNLPLLRRNVEACAWPGMQPITVREHRWGEAAADLAPPFDVVVACDVMYIEDAGAALVVTLEAVSGPHTDIYVAHGRNRQAEGTFLRHAGRSFAVTAVSDAELNSVYQTVDVSVLLLKKRTLSGEELDEAALAH